MTIADPRGRVGRDTARRVIPLFRPYRGRVVVVVGLIVLTSTIGIVNPLLIQAVFNKALFPPGGSPNLELLYILVAIMAVVPIVNGALGILQTYETTMVEMKMTTLARMLEAVVVTTVWTPPTSLASRDWISPVLVPVKKASDSVSRCE